MSRVGKKIIKIPAGVTVEINKSALVVKGSKGELTQTFNECVSFEQNGDELLVAVDKPNVKFQKAIWGTSQAIAANLVKGVSEGFKRELELNGVGYKMELGTQLTLYIGFSHPVVLDIPPVIKLELNKNVLSGESIDNQVIGDFFMNIHNMKPCDPYKQKGFKMPGRHYVKKDGKKGK